MQNKSISFKKVNIEERKKEIILYNLVPYIKVMMSPYNYINMYGRPKKICSNTFKPLEIQ